MSFKTRFTINPKSHFTVNRVKERMSLKHSSQQTQFPFDIKYKALNGKYIGLYSISNSTTNKYRIGNNDINISFKFP